MHQKTIAMNEEELFKDFFKLSEFQNSEESFERYWHWPDGLGNGFMCGINLRPGIMLGIGDYQVCRNLEVSFELDSAPFVFGFGVSGKVQSTFSYEKVKENVNIFTSGQSHMSYLPGLKGITKYSASAPVRGVVIYIDAIVLNRIMRDQHDKAPAGMHDILQGANEKYYYHSNNTTPAMTIAVHQILNCPYRGLLRRLYLESKVLELITHKLSQITSLENGLKNPSPLRHDDIERIHEAKDILIRNIENPPSLLQLARKVGLNDYKLKIGFRQVFGTTVFGYLRECRMERARLLFEKRELNVADVAFAVGYTHLGHFAAMFKKQFGIKPSSYLTEITNKNMFDISN